MGEQQGFIVKPDPITGWEPIPEAIKSPEVFEKVVRLVNEELKEFFPSGILNRIDEIIVFNHLTRIDIWQICGLMIKSVKKRLAEKKINLMVDLSVQAFLTDEGYDPIYGARPLRRAIMKYLEDTLAKQCLSKTLYPNTKIYVNRKRVDGTLMTYTNEIEVKVDFSDVDPSLLEDSKNDDDLVLQTSINSDESSSSQTSSDTKKSNDLILP